MYIYIKRDVQGSLTFANVFFKKISGIYSAIILKTDFEVMDTKSSPINISDICVSKDFFCNAGGVHTELLLEIVSLSFLWEDVSWPVLLVLLMSTSEHFRCLANLSRRLTESQLVNRNASLNHSHGTQPQWCVFHVFKSIKKNRFFLPFWNPKMLPGNHLFKMTVALFCFFLNCVSFGDIFKMCVSVSVCVRFWIPLERHKEPAGVNPVHQWR